jgi:hypothetical protein
MLEDQYGVEVAGHKVDPLLIDKETILAVDISECQAAMLPPGKKLMGFIGIRNCDKAKVEDARVEKNRLIRRRTFVGSKAMRGYHNLVGGERLKDRCGRRTNEDVRVEVDQLIHSLSQQELEERWFDGRIQFEDVIFEGHRIEVRNPEILNEYGLKFLARKVLVFRHAVDKEDIKRMTRMMPQVRVA